MLCQTACSWTGVLHRTCGSVAKIPVAPTAGAPPKRWWCYNCDGGRSGRRGTGGQRTSALRGVGCACGCAVGGRVCARPHGRAETRGHGDMGTNKEACEPCARIGMKRHCARICTRPVLRAGTRPVLRAESNKNLMTKALQRSLSLCTPRDSWTADGRGTKEREKKRHGAVWLAGWAA